MSQKSKHELVETIRPRYLKSSKAEKEQILDEFEAVTGYHRKYAIRVLKHGYKEQKHKKPGRRKKYYGEVVQALERLWEVCGRICSKRLQPFLPELIAVLERCQELELSAEIKTALLQMSCSTIDRLLKRARIGQPKRGLSTTRPGSLLKSAIPIRTYTRWDDQKPGFVEIDLVAHCGTTTEGTYLNTLTTNDLATGWTDCRAVSGKTQAAVFQAILEMQQALPFPLLGIDSDNGSEFINETLLRFCHSQHITFSRSRPYHKNDQAHVEQKNYSVVRRWIGYERLESPMALSLLQSIYDHLRLYINFFQPVLKLTGKENKNDKIIKSYDRAQTPFRRLLNNDSISIHTKAALLQTYLSLNPVTLLQSIEQKVDCLWHLS